MFARLIERDRDVRSVGQALLDQAGEHVPRTHLHEHAAAEVVQCIDALAETHGMGQLMCETFAHRGDVGLIRLRGTVGDDGELQFRKRSRCHVRRKLRGGRCDERRVKRRGDGKRLVRKSGLGQCRAKRLQACAGPAEHGLPRMIVVGDNNQSIAHTIEQCLHSGDVTGDSEHAARLCRDAYARRGHRRHRFTARAGEVEQRVGIVCTAGVQCDQFAEAVTDCGARTEIDPFKQCELRKTHGSKRGLGPRGHSQTCFVGFTLDAFEGRPRKHHVAEVRHRIRHARRGTFPDRKRVGKVQGQVATHAEVLAPLTREEERDAFAQCRRAAPQQRASRALQITGGVTRVASFGDRRREVRKIVYEQREAHRRRMLESSVRLVRVGGQLRSALHSCREIVEPGTQRRLIGAADEHHLHRAQYVPRGNSGAGVFLECHVEVAAAESETAHRCTARMLGTPEPRARDAAEVERASGESECRIGTRDLCRRRQRGMVQREHRLHETRCAGGSFGVPDLRLHGSKRTPRFASVRRGTKHSLQCRHFRSVTGRRAGAMRFDEPDRLWAESRIGIRTIERLHLSFRTGRVDALRAAIAARPDATQQGVDLVTVAFRVVQPAQCQHRDALAEHRAVGFIAERLAVARERQRRRLRKAEEHQDVIERVDAAGDDGVGATAA